MGLLEPDVGHGSRRRIARLTTPPDAFTVHNLRQARAALAAAAATHRKVTVLSAPFASAAAGPAWFTAVVEQARRAHPDAQCTAVLDCGDLPGGALAALRHGLTAIRYDGPQRRKIQEIAAQSGATVLRKRPRSLDLMTLTGDDDAIADFCRRWLSGQESAALKQE